MSRRMTATSATAEALAAYLESHPAVNRVMYPMLSSHPTYALARRYLTRGGARTLQTGEMQSKVGYTTLLFHWPPSLRSWLHLVSCQCKQEDRHECADPQ